MKIFYAIPWMICFFFFQNITIHSQTAISGKVTDKETGEEMIAANIQISQNGIFVQGATTDIDGYYYIRVDPGTYDIEVSYIGYPTQKITKIEANGGQTTKVDAQLDTSELIDKCLGCWVTYYTIPLIRQDENPSKLKITSEKIHNLPTRNINEISSMVPGVSFTQ